MFRTQIKKQKGRTYATVLIIREWLWNNILGFQKFNRNVLATKLNRLNNKISIPNTKLAHLTLTIIIMFVKK